MKPQKSIVITGGARGIGRAIAIRFAREGFYVFLNYKKSKREAEKTLRMIEARKSAGCLIQADVSKEKDVRRLFEKIATATDHVDVLVNNAGWSHYIPYARLGSITSTRFNHLIDANLKTTFLCSRAAVPFLTKSARGLIVNIASLSGIDGKGSNMVYCAAKAGVISLTKSFAEALGPQIRVQAVAPGYVQTDFIADFPPALLKAEKMKHPSGRFATAEAVAEAVFCLWCSKKKVTGRTIVVDGGA